MHRFSQSRFPVWKWFDWLTVSFLPSTATAALRQEERPRELGPFSPEKRWLGSYPSALTPAGRQPSRWSQALPSGTQ